MIKPRALKKGDRVAIVSLSSGLLGESFCSHDVEIAKKRLEDMGLEAVFMPNSLKGIDYLREHPEARASDIKAAFADDSIAGIICAIGGDDTYRLLPYLMEDDEFKELVINHPKIFSGFSDTTVNHLMFYRLGLSTFYGPCVMCDICELADEMLPYTRDAFMGYFCEDDTAQITSSPVWYEERTDFSAGAVGTDRIAHEEKHGFELLCGKAQFEGRLLGGCIESLYDMLTGAHYAEQKAVCEKYGIFPSRQEWQDKILFVETSEVKPTPQQLRECLEALMDAGVFDAVNGVIVGKPQDETYYDEYKKVYVDMLAHRGLSVLYNVNFGHAYPRCVLPYGVYAKVDGDKAKIIISEPLVSII